MKNIILGVTGIMIMLYTAVLALGIYSESARRDELDNSLAEVMDSVMQRYYLPETLWDFAPEDLDVNEEVERTLREEMLLRLSADSQIDIAVTACDMEKGILAVWVEETFRMPTGRSKTIRAEKTLIADVT